jgi:hypothetical protein
MMLATPFTGYLIYVVVGGVAATGYLARRRRLRAEEDAIETWAATNGYLPVEQPIGSTSTLSADNGQAGPCFAVPVGEQEAALFAFSYTVGSGKEQVTVDTTVVQAELAAGFPHFRVVPRHAQHLPLGPGDEQEMDLESIEFHRDHKLLVGRDGDRDALERLFDPETIVWWIALGTGAPIVEYQNGCMVVRSLDALTDGSELDALVVRAKMIAGRVLAEGLLHKPEDGPGTTQSPTG